MSRSRDRFGKDDNYDINNLKEIIKFLKNDIKSSEIWIKKYKNDLIKYKNIPKIKAKINKMLAQEIESQMDTRKILRDYEVELDEELAK